jgi:hypothetical protein
MISVLRLVFIDSTSTFPYAFCCYIIGPPILRAVISVGPFGAAETTSPPSESI